MHTANRRSPISMLEKEGFTMKIETSRLLITQFDTSMARSVHLQSLDEDTRRFVPDEVFETEEEASETVRFLMDCYASGEGPLVYPILLKDGSYIGYVQAVPLEDGTWEIGYHIGKEFTSHGYATEAVRAFLPVILKQLGISRIKGICLAENAASRRVLEKCGFAMLWEGTGSYQGREQMVCHYVYPEEVSPKDLVTRFFEDGYTHKNFQSVMNCVASDYVDHSPAGARSNTDAVNILKIVAGQFSDLKVTMLDVFSEGPMVSTRVLYEGIHTGLCMGVPGTGKAVRFEALENFRVENGKIQESWGYWPDPEILRQLTCSDD